MSDLDKIQNAVCRDLATKGFIPEAKYVAGLTGQEFLSLLKEVRREER